MEYFCSQAIVVRQLWSDNALFHSSYSDISSNLYVDDRTRLILSNFKYLKPCCGQNGGHRI